MKYRALFDMKQFAGYCLWWVRIRQKPGQRWASAPLTAGRTDTEDQAHGAIAEALNYAGIGVEEIRPETERWSMVRDHIRQPGEARRFEGFQAWQAWPGDREALAGAGREFLAAWKAELARRDEVRREAIMRGVEYARFCMATGRDYLRRSADDWEAFREWAVREARASFEEARESYRQEFRFAFHIDTRAQDFAALGLAPGADAMDIKTAWRRLAMRHHPDRGGDHGEFVRLKSAYERLSGGVTV